MLIDIKVFSPKNGGIMIRIILFTSIILVSLNLYAQGILSTVGGKIYLGASAGVSFPLSSFADDNPQSSSSGYAKTGYLIELTGGIRFLNLLELSVAGFRNSNSTDVTNLVNSVSTSTPGITFSGQSDSWEIYGLLFGIGISFPMPQKFIGDILVLGGYQYTSSPEITMTGDVQDAYVKIEGQTVSSPVYLASVSARYPISTSLYLGFGFQYIASSAKFDNVKTTTSVDGETDESTISFSRDLDAWGLNVGLKYFILN
jgi:hypothetical protein